MTQTETEIPFSDPIYGWYRLIYGQSLESLINLSDRYERQYLAWEEVRKGRNPYFENGTGFEGYFVGMCTSPEEALSRILKIGQSMLTNLCNLHRYEARFQSRLLKVLTEDVIDITAMSEWSIELGAMLARLRCNLFQNRKAAAFQIETYQIVRYLPPIKYVEYANQIRQHYELTYRRSASSRLVVQSSQLTDADQNAWRVVQSIGKFGHPLVREFMVLSTN